MKTKRNVILIFIVLLGLSWYTAISEVITTPKIVREHIRKAEELEEKKIYVDAVSEYEQALEYEPDNTDISIKMAKAYLNSGNGKKFTAICEQTVEKDSNNTEAMDILIKYYIENDYKDRAVKYLKNFMESHPDNKNAQKWFIELKGSYTELYCRFDEMGDMVNDSMVVEKDGFYGITDAKGQKMVESEYKEIYPFSEDGFALARNTDGVYIYVDQDGNIRKVPDTVYEDLGMLSSGRVAACKGKKYGFLNEEMEPLGKFHWDRLTGVKNNVGAGMRDGKWVLVNEDGEEKYEEQYKDVIVDRNGFCSAQKRIFVKKEDGYYLINNKGKRIGDLEFDDAKPFIDGEGYAAVCRGDKWGFINSDGELVIDCQYENAESFQNGYAAICEDGLWGYIDIEGNLIIDTQFVSALHFSSSGTAAVKIKEDGEVKWRLIQLNIFS